MQQYRRAHRHPLAQGSVRSRELVMDVRLMHPLVTSGRMWPLTTGSRVFISPLQVCWNLLLYAEEDLVDGYRTATLSMEGLIF